MASGFFYRFLSSLLSLVHFPNFIQNQPKPTHSTPPPPPPPPDPSSIQSPSPTTQSLPSSSSCQIQIQDDTIDPTPHIDHSSSSVARRTTQSMTLHLIIQTLREQELGRHILVQSVPMSIALASVYGNASLAASLTSVALAIGIVGIWNGILLRSVNHHLSNFMEITGISLLFLALFGIIASHTSIYLVWIPCLCWLLSLAPLAAALWFVVKNKPSTTRLPV